MGAEEMSLGLQGWQEGGQNRKVWFVVVVVFLLLFRLSQLQFYGCKETPQPRKLL